MISDNRCKYFVTHGLSYASSDLCFSFFVCHFVVLGCAMLRRLVNFIIIVFIIIFIPQVVKKPRLNTKFKS